MSTPKPASNWNPVNVKALKGVTAPRAMGRRRVRATRGSRSRSHKSLIVQPAPRIMRAPAKKHSEVVRTGSGGAAVYEAAIRVENKQGKKR